MYFWSCKILKRVWIQMFLTKDNLKQGKNHVSVQLIFQILVTGFLFLMVLFVLMFLLKCFTLIQSHSNFMVLCNDVYNVMQVRNCSICCLNSQYDYLRYNLVRVGNASMYRIKLDNFKKKFISIERISNVRKFIISEHF